MKLLTSERFRLPQIFFVTDREELKDLPIGIPFIFSDKASEPYLVRILEYEVIYQTALKTGYPFNFKKLLKENGYLDIEDWSYEHPVYMELTTQGISDDVPVEDFKSLKEETGMFKKFIRDSASYVDIQKLKSLNVFPVWLDTIEEAIHTNIHNFAVYNNNMYNKKLEGMYGALDLVAPSRNLIIIDISSSIPKGVSATCLAMAKNLTESFYADVLITGSKSTLYTYENVHTLNIETIYEENGMDNDQTWFKALLTGDKRVYKTAIVFGDNHSPGWSWNNNYNFKTKTISQKDGQKMCKWEIEKLISFHTSSIHQTAGYADWFEPKEIEKIEDWVKYL